MDAITKPSCFNCLLVSKKFSCRSSLADLTELSRSSGSCLMFCLPVSVQKISKQCLYSSNAFIIQTVQSSLLVLLFYFKQGVLIQTTSVFYYMYGLVLNYYENSKTLHCSKKK